MNRKQQKYLIKRIEEEATEKHIKIAAEEGSYNFCGTRKVKVIIDNKLPIKYTLEEIYAKMEACPNTFVYDLFDTAPYNPNKNAERKKHFADRRANLETSVKILKDNIMLGDAKDVVPMLEAFIKETY